MQASRAKTGLLIVALLAVASVTHGDVVLEADEAADLRPLGRAPTVEEARHLLSRTSFASTEQALAEVSTLGLEAYLDRMLADYERSLIAEALRRSDGIKKRAAALLGVSFRSLRYRLERLGMEKGLADGDCE